MPLPKDSAMTASTLASLSYYQTGGGYTQLYQPTTEAELIAAVKAIADDAAQYYILGAGSNSLVSDEPFEGAVISLAKLNETAVEGDEVRVQAGAINSSVAQLAYDAGLVGLGWMNGLPGQIGGTVRMNARCYGGEISQVVSQVRTVTPEGEIKVYSADDKLFRGYKDTALMDNGELVLEATLSLSKGDEAKLAGELAQMTHCYEDRRSKGQYDYPSCGCVFKNSHHVGVSSGMLLEAAGVKTMATPDTVKVNPKHANFVFNTGGATSRDILEFTFEMREAVYDAFGVWLDYEMEVLGALPKDLAFEHARVELEQLNEERLAPLREAFQQKMRGG